jgi:general nucleoside transport system permease protein
MSKVPSPLITHHSSLITRVSGELGLYLGACAVALLLLGVLLMLLGADPIRAYGAIVQSSLGSLGGFAQTLNKMTPLLFGGLAVALASRGGFLNIGIDGQIYFGAAFATGIAFLLGGLPWAIAVPLVLVAGLVGGAVLALPAAALRAYWGVNEIFVTVMLNFIALYTVDYLTTGPWNDPMAGEAISKPIPSVTNLPMLLQQAGAHSGIILALLCALLVAWFLSKTIAGYELRAVGDNPRAARIGGVNLVRLAIVAMTASGAIAGLAGAVEVAGFHQRLILGLTPGYGYMSILLAVLARRNPIGLIVASFAFAVLLVGSDSLQRSVNLPASAALVVQASVLLVVILAEAARGGGGLVGRLAGWRRPIAGSGVAP